MMTPCEEDDCAAGINHVTDDSMEVHKPFEDQSLNEKTATQGVLRSKLACHFNESTNSTDSQGGGKETSYLMDRISQLSQEVDHLTYQLQQERIGREAMAAASHRADESLAKVLADAWAAVDAEKEAHQATKDDAEEFEREYEYYRDLYHSTEERLYREMVSMKEAMVTVQKVQRDLTKVKEDNEVILDRLVKAKLDYANKCMEYDDLEKNYLDILRLYHGALEGRYGNLTIHSTLSSNDNEQITEKEPEGKDVA